MVMTKEMHENGINHEITHVKIVSTKNPMNEPQQDTIETEQHLALNRNGRVWFSSYHHDETGAHV